MEVQVPLRQRLPPWHRREDAVDRTYECPSAHEHDNNRLYDDVLQVCNNVKYVWDNELCHRGSAIRPLEYRDLKYFLTQVQHPHLDVINNWREIIASCFRNSFLRGLPNTGLANRPVQAKCKAAKGSVASLIAGRSLIFLFFSPFRISTRLFWGVNQARRGASTGSRRKS